MKWYRGVGVLLILLSLKSNPQCKLHQLPSSHTKKAYGDFGVAMKRHLGAISRDLGAISVIFAFFR